MGVGASLYMYGVVVKMFTFAIHYWCVLVLKVEFLETIRYVLIRLHRATSAAIKYHCGAARQDTTPLSPRSTAGKTVLHLFNVHFNKWSKYFDEKPYCRRIFTGGGNAASPSYLSNEGGSQWPFRQSTWHHEWKTHKITIADSNLCNSKKWYFLPVTYIEYR